MPCLTCTCSTPAPPTTGGRLLLATSVPHTASAVLAALAAAGTDARVLAPGLIDAGCAAPAPTLAALVAGLTSTEGAEVRVLDAHGRAGDELLVAAMRAPTLAEAAARDRHADLLPLLADEHGSFRSAYQPIVDLHRPGHPVIGYEALLRATGPDGPLLPGPLFAAAAEAGWLHLLDRIGRTTALRGAAGWLGDRQLFVNFLPTTIYRPEVCLQTTEAAARQAGLRLDQLVFEVTEGERIVDLPHLETVFAHYRQRGCRVALDDLGAGYSSLNVLVRLQPDVVKLDKDIVQSLPQPASVAVVRAVVEITSGYGGQVLVECVETAEQAAVAADLGVHLGQGWWWGRPEERAGTRALTGAATG